MQKAKPTFIVEQHNIYGGEAEIVRTRQSGPNYQFRMWVGDEKQYVRRSLKTRHLETALALAQELFIEIRAAKQKGKTIFSPTVVEWTARYLKARASDVAAGAITQGRWLTIRSQLQHLREYTNAETKTRLSDLDSKSFMEYHVWRRKKAPKVKNVTIRNERATINHWARLAYEEGLTSFPKFIFRPLGVQTIDNDSIRRSTFTPQEYDALVNYLRIYAAAINNEDKTIYALRQMLRHFVLIAANTMMRFGELRQLRWRNVESYPKGKVILANITVLGETSKVKKQRIISTLGGAYFARLRKISKNNQLDDLVFCTPDGKPLPKDFMYREWRQWLGDLKIDRTQRTLTYYSLRHFGISSRIRAGANYAILAQICGTSINQIENTYYHVDPREMEAAALRRFSISKDGVIEQI